MIRLRFNSLAGTDPAMVGPAPYFRIEGPLLQEGPGHTVVGSYSDHHWELGGRYVSSFECAEPVQVQFAEGSGDRSEVYGPFQQVRFPNGSCYADRALLAELLEDGHWIQRASQKRWQALLLIPAESSRFR
jgi:hypothetical protein